MTRDHTPGPWQAIPGAALATFSGTPLQIVAGGRYVAKVDSVTGYRYDESTNARNAQLIAAAPVLLDALIQCVYSMTWAADALQAPAKSSFREDIAAALAAIDAATRGSP